VSVVFPAEGRHEERQDIAYQLGRLLHLIDLSGERVNDVGRPFTSDAASTLREETPEIRSNLLADATRTRTIPGKHPSLCKRGPMCVTFENIIAYEANGPLKGSHSAELSVIGAFIHPERRYGYTTQRPSANVLYLGLKEPRTLIQCLRVLLPFPH
jgi:hypothetical protein